MELLAIGVCLFVGFVFLFLLVTPRPSAAGALLQEAVKPVRSTSHPAWRTAFNVDYLAKPFTLLRSLFTPEPDPKLVHRLMLAGYRKPAHADRDSSPKAVAVPTPYTRWALRSLASVLVSYSQIGL
jgi:hypothetical protein